MVSDEPTEGRCNAKAGRDKDGFCESWPITDENDEPVNGRCRMHGGKGSGAPSGSQNAKKHGMTADPSILYDNLSSEHRDIVDSVQESVVGLLADRWGGREDVPEVHIRHARRLAMNVLKVTVLAEDWQAEQAEESGNPLIESDTREAETGMTYEVNVESKVASVAGALSKENRMWLKDMGILGSPEEQEADAASEVAAAWSESAKQWRMKRSQ